MNCYIYNIISNYSSIKTLFTFKRKNPKGTLPCISHCPCPSPVQHPPSFSVDRKDRIG